MTSLINKTIKFCLIITGFWPYKFSFIGPLILFSALVLTLPFQVWYFLTLIDNIIIAMDNFSDVITDVLIFFKFTLMWIHRRNIADLIQEIIHDWNRKIIPNEWKTIAYYCNLYCKIDIFMYVFCSFFYHSDCISRYLTSEIKQRKSLFSSYYPFHYQESPNFEIIYIMHTIQSYVLIASDSLCKTLLVVYVSHVIAHIHLLKCYVNNYFQNYINSSNYIGSSNYNNLKNIIIEHVNILTLVKKIDNSYSYISLIQIGFSNVLIASSGFTLITAAQSVDIMALMRFILYIIIMLLQSLTFCIIGDFLRTEGETITSTLYNGLWYNTRPKEIKVITFVLEYSQNPLTLNAGKLFRMSVNSFLQILKTSFSYLSVLRVLYV